MGTPFKQKHNKNGIPEAICEWWRFQFAIVLDERNYQKTNHKKNYVRRYDFARLERKSQDKIATLNSQVQEKSEELQAKNEELDKLKTELASMKVELDALKAEQEKNDALPNTAWWTP